MLSTDRIKMNRNLQALYDKLSKSEKRYIDISLSDKKHSKLKSCFDSLSPKSTSNHSAICQTRLLDHMVSSLTNYHNKHIKDFTSNRNRYHSEILEIKQLESLSKKYLSKAKKEAYKYKQFHSLLKIIEIEMVAFKNEGIQLSRSRQHLTNLHNEEKFVLQQLHDLADIRYVSLDFLLLSRNKFGPLEEAVKAEFKSKLSHFESIVNAKNNPEFAIYLFNLKGMYGFNEGHYALCLNDFGNTIDLIEELELGKQVYAREYFFALNNHLMSSVLTKDYSHYKKTRDKIEHRFGQDSSFEYLLFSTTLMYEIGIFNQMGMHDEVLAREEMVLRGLKKHDINNINRHIFYFNLSIAHFAHQNFTQANKYIIELVTDIPQKRSSGASNIYFYALLITLIIRLERKEYDYLKDLIPDIESQLKKIRDLTEFESDILDYVKRVSQNGEDIKRWNFHLARNTVLQDSTYGAFAQQFFDFKSWIKSKLKNTSMQIIRQDEQKISL